MSKKTQIIWKFRLIILKNFNYSDIIKSRKEIQMKENRILMQYFEWYLKPEDKLLEMFMNNLISNPQKGIQSFDALMKLQEKIDSSQKNQK